MALDHSLMYTTLTSTQVPLNCIDHMGNRLYFKKSGGQEGFNSAVLADYSLKKSSIGTLTCGTLLFINLLRIRQLSLISLFRFFTHARGFSMV